MAEDDVSRELRADESALVENAAIEPKHQLDDPLVRRERDLDLKLKDYYAKRLLLVMVLQIAFANTGFFLYGFVGVGWQIEPSVMNVWLTATLVEVIGIVFVVTRSLFPARERVA